MRKNNQSTKCALKRRNTTVHAAVEALEVRAFLSGAVLAQVVEGNLTITGDAAQNVVVVNQKGLKPHQVRILGDSATTINGQAGSVIMNGVKGEVLIRMGNGADSVTLRNIDFPQNLGVSQGARDSLVMNNVTVANNFSLRNSALALPISTTIANTSIGNNLDISSGDGGQHMALQSVEVHGDTRIMTGQRYDVITIDDSMFHHEVEINTGAGVDVVQIEANGNPQGPRTRFYEPTAIEMGTGNDHLKLGVAGQTGNRAIFSDNTRLDGGPGVDTLNRSNSPFLVSPQIRSFESINPSEPSVDIDPPTVSSTNPANLATGVALNRKIAATFSEAMKPQTISNTTVKISAGSTAVAGTVAYVGTTMTFTPDAALTAGTTYTATITTGAKDLAGNALASNKIWTFATGAQSDTTAPTVSSTDPANAATGVALNKKIAATFSEAMDPLTITTANFKLAGPGNSNVSGVVTYVGTTATFTPSSNLAASTVYTATIDTGSEDLAGNALASNKVWTFTTGATADTTAPTVISTDPANHATAVALNKHIAATFSEAMDPLTITTANYTLTGPGSTAVVGTVAYVGTTATFTPAANLAASTLYTATISTGAKDLAGNAVANSQVWTFTTGATPDTTAPTVTLTNPTNLKTNVALNKTISATFSEAIDPLTITTASFKITGPGATNVTGTVVYDAPSKIATFTPSSNLAISTTFTATISGGANGVKDLAGNSLVADKVWTFTTGTQIAQAPIDLGRAGPFAIMARAAISGSGNQINGDVGLHTGTSQGIPTSEVNGTIHVNDQAIIDAQTDLLAAYNDAISRSTTSQVLPGNMGGLTFTPGLYTNSTSVLIQGSGPANNVTLDAQGDPNAIFIFKIGSTLTAGTGSQVILTGGAKAGNIFWQVGTSATLNTGSIFNGNILAATTITVNNSSAIIGRLLGGSTTNGSVTVNSSSVTVPSA